ncbi:GntR family transcriptional regulator [Clostridium sp. MCC353]|uniref:GntR family transcriptional regulator n=1 Tax=Clostridium sp. MCC353 TaxID=2592646 RepID=UPI001C00EB5F|nr:GntR family transcriptional regulator [Clostridium sp. MCC353]MBT9776858.1 GntR family transcriptional regulator [Clostridium sp. MCC353]
METVQAVQTKDYIIRAIRDEILSGRMKPGEELAQENVAQMLGVSRMPVREALQALAQEGFLIRLPNRHMQVAGMDCREVMDTFSVAAAMETEILMLIPENDRDIFFGAVRRCLETGGKEDQSRAAEMEIGIHKTAVSLLRNVYVSRLFSKLLDGYISHAVMNRKGREGDREHFLSRILRAYEACDENGLKQAVKAYYSDLAKSLLNFEEGRNE